MDKFIVSARKYRPQNFNTVVGQSHITTTLKNAIKNNQLAHAFLFCGPRGVGKTTCARILAKTINCTNQTSEGEACNTCNSCTSFDAGASMNIHELDAASNNSVDDIRSLVEQVRFAPQAGKYKVYIVDEVHMLTTAAFNAFLKTLEEPPSYAIFILATTEKHKILPTILSRCQIFDFKRITTNDTVEHLQEIIDKEHIQADKAALQVIAQKSEGCMRDALSILDKIVSFTSGVVNYQNTLEHLNILDHDYYFKLLEKLLAQDMAGAILLYDEINRKGFEGDMVLNGFSEFIRNILVCKDERAIQLLDVVEGMDNKYKTVANSVSTGFLISALNVLSEGEQSFKMARNKRLHVELTIIKLNFLQQAIDITYQNDNISQKKRVDRAIAIQYNSIKQIQVKMPLKSVPLSGSTNGKLLIEEKKTTPPNLSAILPSTPNSNVAQPSKENGIENKSVTYLQAVPKIPASTVAEVFTPNDSSSNKKSVLDLLRAKYGDRYNIEPVIDPIAITHESLFEKWNDFTLELKEEGRNSQSSAFAQSELEIIDDSTFCVHVNSALQQKFIEQEKTKLLDYLQKQYYNRLISFTFKVVESEKEVVPSVLQLNSKQRFERIAAQFPLVLELKRRLKLEIDY